MSEGIRIDCAVLHILDANINTPIYSHKPLNLDSEISEFLIKHIEKLFTDTNLKNARFIDIVDDAEAIEPTTGSNPTRDILAALLQGEKDFYNAGVELTERLFSIMTKNPDIPSGDFLICLFDQFGIPYLGMLKLNYKTGFTHFVSQAEDGNENTIIKYKTILPSDSQRIEEAALINLSSLEIKLMEKAYEINGAKEMYYSNVFLCCSTDLSDNQKLKILEKAAQKINKKYYNEDVEKAAQLKAVVAESLEENNTLEITEMVQEVYKNSPQIQQEYIAEVEKAGLSEKTIEVPEKLAEKKFRSHKIKTDTGIEINFPSSCFNDTNKLEFINNPDGTISIIIKNVGSIVNR